MFHRFDLNGTLDLLFYVGNLAWQVDDCRSEQVFSQHGKVVDVRVVSDRETGRSRGFGFVTMSSETELNDPFLLDGQSLDGRTIRVNVAEERPRRASSSQVHPFVLIDTILGDYFKSKIIIQNLPL